MLFCLSATASVFLFSCKDADENQPGMKAPIEALTGDDKPALDTTTAAEANVKAITDLQEAFKGESNATARYAAFSKKAAAEGYQEIALLFKAASLSEKIHAANHKAVLEDMGVALKPVPNEVKVLTTEENLKSAIAGETDEVTMYPNFLKDANAARNQLALISLNYAYQTEKKHKEYYEQALAPLMGNKVNTLPSTYFVCPTCGNTYATMAPKRCGLSMTAGENCIKINSL